MRYTLTQLFGLAAFTESIIAKRVVAALAGLCFGLALYYRLGQVETRWSPLDQALSELEASLENSRLDRQLLSEKVTSLRDFIATAPARRVRLDRPHSAIAEAKGDSLPYLILELRGDGGPQSQERLEQFILEEQFDRFVAAGIAPDRARLVMQLEDQVEMEALRARFAATQSGATSQELEKITPMAIIRTELGDGDYEKYLEARGRQTSITVGEVLKNSPAETAGIKPGDQIIAYNGQRAFDMDELVRLAFESSAGTTVPLDVIRDGQTIQIYIQSGYIGIGGEL